MATATSDAIKYKFSWLRLSYELVRFLTGIIALMAGILLMIPLMEFSDQSHANRLFWAIIFLLLVHFHLILGVWLLSIAWQSGRIISRYNFFCYAFRDSYSALLAVCMFGIILGTYGSTSSIHHPFTAFFLAQSGVDVSRLETTGYVAPLAFASQLSTKGNSESWEKNLGSDTDSEISFNQQTQTFGSQRTLGKSNDVQRKCYAYDMQTVDQSYFLSPLYLSPQPLWIK